MTVSGLANVGVLGGVQVVTGAAVGTAISGVVGGVGVTVGGAGGGGIPHKKKRSHTEDESETDQMVISAKEEDPWSLTEQIDASSDYLDTQIAGKCRFFVGNQSSPCFKCH